MCQPALCGERLQIGGNACQRALDRALLRIGQQDPMPRLRGDLRNAGAHGTGADYADEGFRRQAAGHVYCPVKRGARLSMNAVTPSR